MIFVWTHAMGSLEFFLHLLLLFFFLCIDCIVCSLYLWLFFLMGQPVANFSEMDVNILHISLNITGMYVYGLKVEIFGKYWPFM